jgi:hypothetical protein
MSPSAPPFPPMVAPHQVWEKLPNDLKVRAIQCLAQLAFSCATTAVLTPDQETRHECAIPLPKDRPAPS